MSPGFPEHNALVLAALERAGVFVRDLARKFIRIRIGARIHIAHVAHAVRAEPCHDKDAPGRLDRPGGFFLIRHGDQIPAQDRGERT